MCRLLSTFRAGTVLGHDGVPSRTLNEPTDQGMKAVMDPIMLIEVKCDWPTPSQKQPHRTNRTCLPAPLVVVTAVLFKSRLQHLSLSLQQPGLCCWFRAQIFLDSVAAVLSSCVLRRQYAEESHCMSMTHSCTAHIKHSAVLQLQKTCTLHLSQDASPSTSAGVSTTQRIEERYW